MHIYILNVFKFYKNRYPLLFQKVPLYKNKLLIVINYYYFQRTKIKPNIAQLFGWFLLTNQCSMIGMWLLFLRTGVPNPWPWLGTSPQPIRNLAVEVVDEYAPKAAFVKATHMHETIPSLPSAASTAAGGPPSQKGWGSLP